MKRNAMTQTKTSIPARDPRLLKNLSDELSSTLKMIKVCHTRLKQSQNLFP